MAAVARELRCVRAEALPKMKGGLRALYRTLELPGANPLKDAHAALDTAVLTAYGFNAKKDLLAQLLALSAPVRADTGGSVESLVWLLTRELAKLGHEVTVFATAGSEVDGEVVTTMPGPYAQDSALEDWHLCEWVNLCRAVAQSGRFDVLHSHAYLWGIPLQPLSRVHHWFIPRTSCRTATRRSCGRPHRDRA